MTDTLTLLSLCARTTSDEKNDRRLVQATEQFAGWDDLPAAAEYHGLAPLVYHRLKAAGAAIPQDTRRALAALAVRHRHAYQVRVEALSDILTAFDDASIQVVILKGAALAEILYPEPGLRPMRDLDLFVADDQIEAARKALGQLEGYAPELDKGRIENHVVCNLLRDQLRVSVELHFRIPGTKGEEPIPFSIGAEGGPPAYILNHDEMLRHLCHHTTGHCNVFEVFRLIWATDIVSFAEQFVDEIDWEGLRHEREPNPVGMLSLLHPLIPLSERLRDKAGVQTGGYARQLAEDDLAFCGWPRYSLAMQKEKGMPGILHDTLLPREWWLRLHYGLSSEDPLFWYRWVRHPLEIAGWARQLLNERMSR